MTARKNQTAAGVKPAEKNYGTSPTGAMRESIGTKISTHLVPYELTLAAAVGIALMILHTLVHLWRAVRGLRSDDYRRVNIPVEEIAKLYRAADDWLSE